MCLSVKKYARIRTAKEDIVVWKRLECTSEKNHFKSPFYGYTYYAGKRCAPIKLEIVLGEAHNRLIEEGYHAYTRRPPIPVFDGSQIIIIQMIIPKGAKYCLGDNNEIVSSRIKFPTQ